MILNMNGGGKDKNLLPENIVSGVEIDGVIGIAPKFEMITETFEAESLNGGYAYWADGDALLIEWSTSTTYNDMVLEPFATTGYTGFYATTYNNGIVTPTYSFAGLEVLSCTSIVTASEATEKGYTLLNSENLNKDFAEYFYGYANEITDSLNSSGGTGYTRFKTQHNWEPIIYCKYHAEAMVENYGMPAYKRSSDNAYQVLLKIKYVGKFIRIV